MADQQDPRDQQYERAHDAFEDLKIEDKTVFLLKETVNTIVEGVETCVRTITDEFGAMFGEAPADTEEAEAKAGENGAAKSGKKKTTRAKTTRAKTGSKKRTTSKRTSSKKDDSDDA